MPGDELLPFAGLWRQEERGPERGGQRGLSDVVRPVEDVQAAPQLDVGGLDGAEPVDLQPHKVHQRLRESS